MAMGSISSVNANIMVQPQSRVAERTREAELEVKKQQEEEQEREQRGVQDLGHPDPESMTVARSIDGDTTSASRIGIENAREGIVMKKSEDAQRPQAVGRTEQDIAIGTGKAEADRDRVRAQVDAKADAKADAKEERENKPSKPMTGYTDTQIEQMLDQGRISRQDYDQEMDRRERIAEESGMAEAAEEKENPVIKEAKEASAEKVQNEIGSKKEESKAQETKASLKEAEKTEEENAGENRKQLITEEMENDKEFASRMSEINTMQQDFSLKADGIANAIANDREELFQNVMEAAQKVAATEPTQ